MGVPMFFVMRIRRRLMVVPVDVNVRYHPDPARRMVGRARRRRFMQRADHEQYRQQDRQDPQHAPEFSLSLPDRNAGRRWQGVVALKFRLS
jgi:hypothetical protein